MFKLFVTLALIVLVNACSSDEVEDSKALIVKSVTFDNENSQNIQQIVIEFNQDVAVLGAIPTKAQINAVTISPDSKEVCSWRFINLNKLSCELKSKLQFLTQYNIQVDKTFSAFGKTLSEAKTVSIETGLPNFIVGYEGGIKSFPKKITIEQFSSLDIPLDALNNNLQLKLPNGEYEALNIEETLKYQEKALSITPRRSVETFPQGHYQLVLPKGFKASDTQVTLNEDVVLDDFWFSTEFQFYGFACLKEKYRSADWISDISIDSNGELNCKPENLAISLSQPIDMGRGYRPVHSVDWLSGPEYSLGRAMPHKGKSYHSLNLSGESHYELDLSKVKSLNGSSLKNKSTLVFNTLPATPLWYFDSSFGTVVESDTESFPTFLRRNVKDMYQDTLVIESADELQQFLNNELKNEVRTVVPAAPKTIKSLHDQPVDFRQYLSSNRGMAFVSLTGLSTDIYGDQKTKITSKAQMFQSVDYNLAAWNGKDLLVQAISWEATPINGAHVLMVCEGNIKPVELGATDGNGILWVKAQDWSLYTTTIQNKDCWIWTQTLNQFSVIKLPTYERSVKDEVNAFAWTAQPIYQPNETVNIGAVARKRSISGLTPLTNLSDYEFWLVFPDKNEEQLLEFGKFGEFGFSSASFELSSDAQMGEYIVVIKEVTSEKKQRVGSFIVAEFTPPEFEFSVDYPEKITFGKHLVANVNANRMNGELLRNATAKITLRISRTWSTPKSWPDEFEFNSWDDFEKNKNDKESIMPVEVSLGNSGQYSYESEPLKSTVPYAEVMLTTEVKSDDGEVQTQQSRIPYFSRQHYIGTKFDTDSRQLNVIAIDQNGIELNNINAYIKVLSTDEESEGKLVYECTLSQLPGHCNVGDLHERVDLEIESGVEKYKWFRGYNLGKEVPSNPLEYKEKFEFTDSSEVVLVGDKIQLNLNSSIVGKASLILQAGEIRKIWTHEITKGTNSIDLDVDPSWVPYARVFATLPVDRELARELTNSKIQNTDIDSNTQLTPKELEDILGSQRLLTSDTIVKVAPIEAKPMVELALNQEFIQAGTEAIITISSNVNADSQIWLVNEALLDLMNKSEKDFDYNNKVTSQYAFEGELKFDALSEYLVLDSRFKGGINGLPSKVMQRNRVPPPSAGLSFNIPSFESTSVDDSVQKSDFAQSIWLGTTSLIAGKKEKVKVKLPQLIGRWKVLALTATAQTMSIDSALIKTTRDVEYFLDVPNSILVDDKADFAITKINKTTNAVTDELTLWVDGHLHSKYSVQLDSNEYKRTTINLPRLSPGKHLLKITSKKQSEFAALSLVSVSRSDQVFEKVWLQNTANNTEFMLPESYVKGSLQVMVKKAGQQSPDWHSLLETNKNYPHQCWEQTISRAAAYQFNPLSESEWSEGASELNKLITTGQQNLGYMGLYSYFPNMSPDPFLTAYSYFVSALLETSTMPIDSNKEELHKFMLDFLEDGEFAQYLSVTSQAKSMALLALAYNKQIDLDKALHLRQSLGASDYRSSLFQALALKHLGADKGLYEDVLSELHNEKYQDENLSVFNQNSDKCFAALVYDPNSQQRETLLDEVVTYQQQNESFGSTFADAICSYALKDKVQQGFGYNSTNFKINGNKVDYHLNQPEPHWLKISYAQHLNDIEKSGSGITVQRKHYVERNDQWEEITQQSIQIGELVKTTITINSPKDREHIAISDSIAGGFEAINPALGNQHYINDLGRNWVNNNRIEIRNGKAYWYLRHLSKGSHDISYYSRVRFSGEFKVAPAKVEAMYRTDVLSNTDANIIIVER